MSKTNKTEEPKQEKVMTKYDRKMQERKKQAEKDKRDNLISKLTAIAVAVVLIAAIVISIGISVSNKHKAVSGVAVQVGDHDITALETPDVIFTEGVSRSITGTNHVFAIVPSFIALTSTVYFSALFKSKTSTVSSSLVNVALPITSSFESFTFTSYSSASDISFNKVTKIPV